MPDHQEEPVRFHPEAVCEDCPLRASHTYVPSRMGSGGLAVVGKAPGRQEVRHGSPFVGASGRLLAHAAKRAGAIPDLRSATIANAVSCMPPGDAVPGKALKACAGRLAEELASSRTVLALGTVAGKAVLGRPVKLADESCTVDTDALGRPVVVSPHPAGVLRTARLYPDLTAALALVSGPRVEVFELPPTPPIVGRDLTLDTAVTALDATHGPLIVDVEATRAPEGNRTHPRRLRCIGIAALDGQAWIVPEELTGEAEVKAALSCALERRGIIAHNAKFDRPVLRWHGIEPGPLDFDPMLGSVLLSESPGGKGLEAMARRMCGAPRWKHMIHRRDYDGVAESVLHRYLGMDLEATRRLTHALEPQRTERLLRLLLDASCMLEGVEERGMGIDPEQVDALTREVTDRERTKDAIFDLNPRSWQQIKAQFARLGVLLKSTDENHLREVSHPPEAVALAKAVLDYRGDRKLLGTYLRPLADPCSDDGRVHPTFWPTGTETGRLSCSKPNIQNQPGAVLSCFTAAAGHVLVAGDLKQGELRVIAVESGDQAMISLCRTGDLHREIALATGLGRREAKSVSFGVAFGRSPEGISHGLGLDKRVARGLVEQYFARFPEILTWQARLTRMVRSGEPLRTHHGRYRRFPETDWADEWTVRGLLREAWACIPQGTSSDITLRAAIELDRDGWPIVNLVHDAIYLEVPEGDEVDAAKALQESALRAGHEYSAEVDFPMDVKWGRSWGELKGGLV